MQSYTSAIQKQFPLTVHNKSYRLYSKTHHAGNETLQIKKNAKICWLDLTPLEASTHLPKFNGSGLSTTDQ